MRLSYPNLSSMRLLLPLLLVSLTTSSLAVNNRSVSGSQQFTIICPDRDLRQNLTGAFDEVRRGLFSELGIQLGAQTPIYVNVQPRKIAEYSAKTCNTRWLEAPEGARVQLDVLVDDNMPAPRMQEHIVNALLLTIKYRNNPPPGGQMYSDPPAWMVEGLSEKIRLQTREPDAALYRGLLNAKRIPELENWLKVVPGKLDAAALGIYRAYACSLIAFFTDQPNGKKKLAEFLERGPSEPMAALDWLAKAFPNMGEKGKNLAKWWSLSLAKLSASDRYLSWSGPDTNKALEAALELKISEGTERKTFQLEQYQEFIKSPGFPAAVATLKSDLVRLTIHAHPLYRPLLAGYQDVAERLQRGRVRNLDAKLGELQTLRADLNQRLQDVSDYLTWFEATQAAKSGPGEFDSYFRLMESFRQPRPPSREPIGRYMDAMEAEMRN